MIQIQAPQQIRAHFLEDILKSQSIQVNDISGTYTFKVLQTSITDNNGNTFQTSTEDDKLDIDVDTVHPTTSQISTDSTTKESTFDVDVTFSESVNNVDIGNFAFIDGTVSVGEITKVEVHSDTNFNDTNPSTTTDQSTLSGRYFRVSIKPSEDINGTYTFTVLSTSITDQHGNSFQASTDDDTLDIDADTERAPTLETLSLADPITTPKTRDFKINVAFSEVVYDVNKIDFQFTDGSASVGDITQVEAVDSNFNSKDPSVITTDDTAVISGRYFIVSVNPNPGLLTDTAVTYTFEVLSAGIADGASKTLDETLGVTPTLDITVDTLAPQIISSEIVNESTCTYIIYFFRGCICDRYWKILL